MSLEELKAQAEAPEEVEEQPTQEPEAEDELELPEEPEATDEEAEEPEAVEPSDDFELELDGEPEPEQQKPSAEDALVHKLTKQRKRAKEAESQVEKLERQVQELTDMLKGGKPAQPTAQPQAAVNIGEPTFPDMYDQGIDGDRQKYSEAVKKYLADMQAYQARHSEAAQQHEQYRKSLEEKTANLAKRAAKFMQENKISEDRVINALEKATSEIDQATGIDGALAYLLDSVGDGGERAAYYIGTNDNAMATIKRMLQEDPNGLKAGAQLTRWAEKLKPKHSKLTSKAPPPDEALKGDGSPVTAKRLQEAYDRESNPTKLMELRRKAKERGVKLA